MILRVLNQRTYVFSRTASASAPTRMTEAMTAMRMK
jgi:hypothetical protein